MKTAMATLAAGVAALAFASGCDQNHASHDHWSSGHDCSTHAAHAAPAKDIVDTAVAAGSFDTLVTAVTEADLADTLRGDGPFTVFAPTDAAFAKLPEGTIPALLNDKDRLRAVLLYHVVPGKVTAADVVKLSSAKTAQGASLPIRVHGSSVRVGAANVTQTDVMAANGVIHVIDTVLIPPTH
jgi:uncharacterized surface protein with fasciclin (FAS1) repeats